MILLESIMKNTKEVNQKKHQKHNSSRTKENAHARILEIKESEDLIIVESTKRRVNMNLNDFVVRQIDAMFENRSELVEKYFIDLIEKELGKKLYFTKSL